MLGAVDFAAHPVLLPVDQRSLRCGKCATVGGAVGLDLPVDGGFALLQPRRLASAQSAGRKAVGNAILLILAPRAHYSLGCWLRDRVMLVGVDLPAHLVLLPVDGLPFLAG